MVGNRQDFEKIEAAVDLAVEHIIQKGCDDIFKPPAYAVSPEKLITSQNTDEFRKVAKSKAIGFLKTANLTKPQIGKAQTSLAPKDEHTYRQVAWIDPFDSVKFLALTILLFETIEKSRIPKEKNILHSHRKSETSDSLFDEKFGYDSFLKTSGEMSISKTGEWKVITDISNFFDRIGNHSLENHLLDAGCEEKYVELVRETLLFWSGDRRSFGVPVGSDASRILAEAALLTVDRKLHDANIEFLRYVDDYRLFAKTKPLALKAVQILTTLLAEEGLQLNSKKTRIQRIETFVETSELDDASLNDEHEMLDLNEKKLEIRRIQVSGRSNISRFYREPGKEALRKIRALSKEELLADLQNASDSNIENQIRLTVKYFIYSDDQDVSILNAVLDRKITSIIYISDALAKEAERFSPEKRDEIATEIFNNWDWKDCSYPLQLPALRIASSPSFARPDLIKALFDNHMQTDNAIFFREALLLGSSNLDRSRIRKLAMEVFPNAPNFLKRAIYLAVKDHPTISNDEKRPLLKNMKQGCDDWYVNLM